MTNGKNLRFLCDSFLAGGVFFLVYSKNMSKESVAFVLTPYVAKYRVALDFGLAHGT